MESLSNIRDKKTITIKFNLRKTAALLKELKINLNQFKFVHIAGTSGKGSVTAMTHNMLRESGYSVGSIYSPHTTTIIERIKVNNKYIAPVDFVRLLDKIKPVWEKIYWQDKKMRPTFQQIILGIALLYFQEKKCQYVVLETSVGGEHDSTNIIKKPLAAVITNIGLDHTKILGKTLPEIARSKAGIIKPGVPVITAEKKPAIVKIFGNRAKRYGCPFYQVRKNDEFDVIMNGNRQNINANLAAKIGEILGLEKEAIRRGIKKTALPCRLEVMSHNPTIILDGAHNPDKIKSTVESLKKFQYKKLILIFALNENKDERKITKIVAPVADKVFVTRHLHASRACNDLKLLYNLFLELNKKIKAEIAVDPWQALGKAISEAKKDDLILITGSFYLAGELRKKWISEEKILKDNSGK